MKNLSYASITKENKMNILLAGYAMSLSPRVLCYPIFSYYVTAMISYRNIKNCFTTLRPVYLDTYLKYV